MMLGLDPDMMQQAWSLMQVTGVAAAAGWTADRLLDPGIESRGIPLLSGLFGLVLGPRLAEATGWPGGPEIAGYPLAAAFVGALAVCTFLKLAHLAAAASSRR